MDKADNVLYYNEDRMIDDNRFNLTRTGNNWNLLINKISPLDAGQYRCVVNTDPVQVKFYGVAVLGKYSIIDIIYKAEKYLNRK